MADIFVSYARVDKQRVAPLIAALEAEGWSVWWDPEINPGQEFDQLIRKELGEARSVIVVWTPASVESRWVRGEARLAADRSILVPVRFDRADLPIDALSLHTTDLDEWREDTASRPFRDLVRALTGLIGSPSSPGKSAPASSAASKVSVCVLPFTNMSGDVEQEYFSDGISEDIITDLSKISSLVVASRNSAFAYKGKQIDLLQVARQLRVSHILEGSVRKAGNRVRITAQLIDGSTNNHIWAERYDRDLSDIFALQDEISKAIVGALKLKLLPEEKKAIGQRGTTNAEAYRLFLMARQYATKQTTRYSEFAARLLEKAVELDPNYAAAWAKLARIRFGNRGLVDIGDPEAALNRAMEIDPNSAEALATRAHMMVLSGNAAEGEKRIKLALGIDPESYEVHNSAANICMLLQKYADAVLSWEKTASLLDTDFASLSMAVQCYQALGDEAGAKSAAQRSLKRIEQELLQDPANSDALAHGAGLLVVLGEHERAKEWASRALLLDPGNVKMLYNLGCAMALSGNTDSALEFLKTHFAHATTNDMAWARQDTDLDSLRGDPRFKAMIAEAEKRLAAATPRPE